jgi:hypothetical protein
MTIGGPNRVTTGKGWANGEVTLPLTAAAQGSQQPSDSQVSRWPAARIAAVEALWGAGFIMPGGGPETVRLAKPLGLTSSMTLLLLGAGLGGPAHAISDGFGSWVASFEADPELCAAAASRRAALDQRNRITIERWDRGQPAFRKRSANFALSLEALRGTPPEPLLQSLAGALRPQGQIVLTELVCDAAPNDRDREFAAWCRLENRLPEMPTQSDVTGALQRLRFDVRIVEDMSDRHITQTLGGWREAVRAMAAGPRPAAHTAAAFVTEAELWLLRIRLMRRLSVKLMRWHAIGSA